MMDMHCHLDLYKNPHQIVAKCKEQGLYILSVTTTPKAWSGTNALALGCERIRTALGLHPQLAHERDNELELFRTLLPSTKYVGEIGLEGGKEFKPYRQQQLNVFRTILRNVESAGGRIMSIHSRSAATEVLDELSKFSNAGTPILHWFSGNKAELDRAIALGCWFSVGPAMLRTKRGIAITSEIPKEKLLPETDGPFAMMGNNMLMPWDVNLVLRQLSNIWEEDLSNVQNLLLSNFRSLLTK